MENQNYQLGQTVYEVGIDCISEKVNVREQKILCVGNQSLFVIGVDTIFGGKVETTLRFSAKDDFKAEEAFKSNYHVVWTDDREKAYHYAQQMREIQKMKTQYSKAV